MNYFIEALKKYAVFSGRARRAEYWYFALFMFVTSLILAFIDGLIGGPEITAGYGILGALFSLATLLPSLGVSVRRLHDTGRSGWWLLIILVPIVGAIVLLVMFCQESSPEANAWGPSPKAAPAVPSFSV